MINISLRTLSYFETFLYAKSEQNLKESKKKSKQNLKKNIYAKQNLKERIDMTRLRIGHSKITHEYLLSKTEPPFCNQQITTCYINAENTET